MPRAPRGRRERPRASAPGQRARLWRHRPAGAHLRRGGFGLCPRRPGRPAPGARPPRPRDGPATPTTRCSRRRIPSSQQGERLGTRRRVLQKHAAHGRGHGQRPRLAHAAHRHAEVFGLDADHYALRADRGHHGVGDLGGQALLDLRAVRGDLDGAGQLGQPGDAPLARHIGDVRPADEGQQVVLAHRVERNVPDDDHFVGVALEDLVDLLGGGPADAPEQFREGAGHSGRGLAQAIPIGVLADRLEHHADGPLDLRRIVAQGPAQLVLQRRIPPYGSRMRQQGRQAAAPRLAPSPGRPRWRL
jgi:hypothetical protein